MQLLDNDPAWGYEGSGEAFGGHLTIRLHGHLTRFEAGHDGFWYNLMSIRAA